MKIENVLKCNVCRGENLETKRLLVEDLLGEISNKEVKVCKDCDTIHYIYNGVVVYDFSVAIYKNVPKYE